MSDPSENSEADPVPVDQPETQTIEQWRAAFIEGLARARVDMYPEGPPRVFSDGQMLIGYVGEFAFGDLVGLMPRTRIAPEGDGGVDFRVTWELTIDVKTYRKPLNLLVERGKVKADIYVLGSFLDADHSAKMLGWEWGSILRKAPCKDFGHGVFNHYIPREQLRDINILLWFCNRHRNRERAANSAQFSTPPE